MTIKPLKIAAQIIFMDRQMNLNKQTFKTIPYNQEKYKLNMMHDFYDSVYYELLIYFVSLYMYKNIA